MDDIVISTRSKRKSRVVINGDWNIHQDDRQQVLDTLTGVLRDPLKCSSVTFTVNYENRIKYVTFRFAEENRYVARSIFRNAFYKEIRADYTDKTQTFEVNLQGWMDNVLSKIAKSKE